MREECIVEEKEQVSVKSINDVEPDILPTDIHGLTTTIVNVYFVSDSTQKDNWVLVDTGIPGSTEKIIQEAEKRFGEYHPPKAIILTHGHFDHVGAVKKLVEKWNVPVYAHKDEIPYLKGEKSYPPGDPSVGGGLLAMISPLYPNDPITLGDTVHPLSENDDISFMPDWRVVHTPGHTPGHISLFRERDGALIVGDAFITVKQESAMAVMTQEEEIHGPPAYFTPDWDQARESVKRLEALHPSVAYTGHGQVIYGEKLRNQLKYLADNFDSVAIPKHGRYVN
jgi:glyoxylase-like metal-dependent hydrolase (beta-lactamase superfamily II)